MATLETIRDVIQDLSVAFLEKHWTDAQIVNLHALYCRMFITVEDDRLKKATELIIRQSKFWPSVHELLEAVDHIPTQSPAREADELEKQWWYTFGGTWEQVTTTWPPDIKRDEAKIAFAEAEYKAGR